MLYLSLIVIKVKKGSDRDGVVNVLDRYTSQVWFDCLFGWKKNYLLYLAWEPVGPMWDGLNIQSKPRLRHYPFETLSQCSNHCPLWNTQSVLEALFSLKHSVSARCTVPFQILTQYPPEHCPPFNECSRDCPLWGHNRCWRHCHLWNTQSVFEIL